MKCTATSGVDAKDKQLEMKNLKTALEDYDEGKETVTGEINVVLGYFAKLKPQCESNAPSHAEVIAAREAEIRRPKEALDFLAGDDVERRPGGDLGPDA